MALVSTAAHADCTTDSTGKVVTCTGSSTGYSNLSNGVSLTSDTSATVTGPVLLGNTANVTNGGSMTSTSTTSATLQVGTSSTIVNNGTIAQSTGSTSSPAVLMGDSGTFTNNGSLSAASGSTVIEFGQAGTFNNTAAATAAVVGNISFGPNVAGGTSTLSNTNTTYGITGNIYSTGNTSIYNDGLIVGSIVQTPTGGTVAITNDTAGTFTGSISTGDVTTVTNRGTMSLTGASSIGSGHLGVSSFTNNGTLNVGTAAPTQLVVNGGFTNGSSGVLNIVLHSSGAASAVAGSTYSQIYASGTNGTATLGGTLNLVPTAGFYASGSTYDVVLADQSVTGNFATVNGDTLPFISFVPVGIVTIGTQQAYEVQAVRSTTYADVIASVATPSQLAIARALEPLVSTANADTSSTAATLIGDIDLLTVPQLQTLLDQINPASYLAYAQAMNDQVNLFDRQVMQRTLDARYPDSQTGWWLQGSGQFHIGKTPTDGYSEGLWGIAGGFDTSGRHWVAGAALGYSSATVKNGLASLNGHNTAYIVGGYGVYHAGPVNLTGQVDYDIGKVSASKTLSLAYTTTTTAATSTTAATTTTTATNTSVSASPGDQMFKASATAGFDVHLASLVKATPFVGVSYMKGSINAIAETDGGAADLNVSRISIDRTDLLAGVDVTTTSGDFRPYLRAAYRSQVGGDRNPAVSAYFNDDPTTLFTVNGDAISRHEADIDAGVNIVDDEERMSIFVGYQGTIRKQMSNHGITGGIRIQL